MKESVTLDQEQVWSVLQPHIPIIQSCFRDAWRAWRGGLIIHPEAAAALGKRSRASEISDYIAYFVRQRLEGTSGVVLARPNNAFVAIFDDAVMARFKKTDRHGRTANVQTIQQLDMFHRQEFRTMPMFAELVPVTIGYLLDPAESALADLRIIYEKYGRPVWIKSIGLGAEPLDLTQATPNLPTTGIPSTRISPKISRATSEEADGT